MTACYYNDNHTPAAAWLLELAHAGELPPGYLDTRSIHELQPDDLGLFHHVHLFAGIGGWAYALKLAGWPDDRPVWTGSCPCQPFSCAGKQAGTADARHLWPEFLRLIAECRPPTIFGEQVAGKAGREWLTGVRADLEALGYAFGAADLCAASVGAPHIRQRLYWVAQSKCDAGKPGRTAIQPGESLGTAGTGPSDQPGRPGSFNRLAHSSHSIGRPLGFPGSDERDGSDAGWAETYGKLRACGKVCGMGFAERPRRNERQSATQTARYRDTIEPASSWSDFDVVRCLDERARRVEPGTFPLAHGIPNRVGLLRGYGNAIVPALAATFIEAFLETEN